MPGAGSGGGDGQRVPSPLSLHGQRPLPETGLCGYVHGAGGAAAAGPFLPADRTGSYAGAAGHCGSGIPLGHPAGGEGMEAAAAVFVGCLPRAEDAADGDPLQRGAAGGGRSCGKACPVERQHPYRGGADAHSGGADADLGPGGQWRPACRHGAAEPLRCGHGLRAGL